MGKATTTFTCQRCAEPFEHVYTVGRKPQYCKPCKLEIKRATARTYIAATYIKRVSGVPETFPCADCAQPFEFTHVMGRIPERCRPCQRQRARDMTNAARREKRASCLVLVEKMRITFCEDCSTKLVNGARGGVRKRCDDCRLEAKRERGRSRPHVYKLKPPRSITCTDCSAVVQLPLRGASKQKRCAGCAVRAARAIQKRMNHERRAVKAGAEAEAFTSLEIFERDGWKCGICKKRINKRLAHPHPLSASLDHMVPISQGGGHVRTNVQAAHLTCNLRKYNLGGGEQLLLVG